MNLGSIWSNNPKPSPIRQTITNNTNNINNTVKHVNKAATRSYWGSAVWFFFHTISCRINTNFYASNYKYVCVILIDQIRF